VNIDAKELFGMIKYKGYFIVGTAAMVHPRSPDWRALGIVWSQTPEGFVVEIERSGGRVFTTKVSAERHGLELCQEWVDERTEETLSARSRVSSSGVVRNPV
jgi:hypothetical protein